MPATLKPEISKIDEVDMEKMESQAQVRNLQPPNIDKNEGRQKSSGPMLLGVKTPADSKSGVRFWLGPLVQPEIEKKGSKNLKNPINERIFNLRT